MPLAHDFYTADMVRAMPDDGNRYEVVWGELFVTPSPVKQHQRIVRRLLIASGIRRLRLVVEVLSPSTARRDRFQKRKLYQANGVEMLWLVDAERRLVETWMPEQMLPMVESERVVWHPRGAALPLTLGLEALFES
jgi:Uma2 family endonuclease